MRNERLDLLRHEHGRGLVEDDDLGTSVEDLQDLDPLPLADTEVFDELVGVEPEAVRVGDPLDLGACGITDPVHLLGAEHDVLGDSEVVGELEVLEDHADPVLDGARPGRTSGPRCR